MHPMPIKFFHGHDPRDEMNNPSTGKSSFAPTSWNAILGQIVDPGQKINNARQSVGGSQPMCVTRGFRQAVARRATHHVIDGGGETDPVPDGDINRFHARARAQHRTNDFRVRAKRATAPII
jgi:hypothetical protein